MYNHDEYAHASSRSQPVERVFESDTMISLEAAGRPRAQWSKGRVRGKSELHRAGSRVTPVRREARTSATVTMPARSRAGVKRGKLEPEQDRIGGRKAAFAPQQAARSALG